MDTYKTETIAFRLKPGTDLYKGIDSVVQQHNIEAGWMVTIVGSLTHYNIRFANQPSGSAGQGHFEILAVSGTLSVNGCHLHISIADTAGSAIGGHLLEGCTVYTTAEVVIQKSLQYTFLRQQDGSTPWRELQIQTNHP